MRKSLLAGSLALAVWACAEQQPPPAASATGLKKIRYHSAEELQKLRAAGAEIIVQQSDYVVVRVDSAAVSALSGVPAEQAQEKDLVQRLVHIKIDSVHDVQQIVDGGLDLWEAKGDTAIARAFDVQLERLRQAGFEFRIAAQDANQLKGGPQ